MSSSKDLRLALIPSFPTTTHHQGLIVGTKICSYQSSWDESLYHRRPVPEGLVPPKLGLESTGTSPSKSQSVEEGDQSLQIKNVKGEGLVPSLKRA